MRVNYKQTCVQNFKGKVHLYSDFDGTYCPEKHSEMHNLKQNPKMLNYCDKMRKFFSDIRPDFKFHITTGRTFGEFEAVLWLLKMRGYHLPLPDSVITKNGSDQYYKSFSDDEFYYNGLYPYNYSNSNKTKELLIKKLTNWNGKKFKDYIKAAANKIFIKYVEAESENSVRDYGDKSLFSNGKLKPNDWQILPQKHGEIVKHENPVCDYVLGLREDGDLKTRITFPPDYGYCPFRTSLYDSYVDDIKDYLLKNNIAYVQSWEPADNKNFYRISTTIVPKIDGKELNKVFDTKLAVLEAKKNNDLVLVAGDGSNDFNMLNPLEYISDKEWEKYSSNTNCPEFFYGDINKKILDLKLIYRGYQSEYISELRDELTKNGFLSHIENLPFVGIVINKHNSHLMKLVDTFAPIGKIVLVDKGQLDTGIKIAVKKYAEKHLHFKNTMTNKSQKTFDINR